MMIKYFGKIIEKINIIFSEWPYDMKKLAMNASIFFSMI